MLKNLRLLLIVLFSVATAACSNNTIKKDFSFDNETAKGVLLGSITYDGYYSEYGVYYRNLSGDHSNYVSIGESVSLIPINAFLPAEIEDSGRKGEVFGVDLEPGVYEFHSWKVSSAGISTHPKKMFSLKFEVKPGIATYIGNFNFNQTSSKGLTVTGASVEFSKADRDLKVIQEKYKNITTVSSLDDQYSYNIGENNLSDSEFFLKAFEGAINNQIYLAK